MNKIFKNEQELKSYLEDLEMAINEDENFYWQEDMFILINLIKTYLKNKEEEDFNDWLIDREESVGE